ncbi:hypothetical protein SKAU_G00338340 [Synaphobranchus kaupii]|uniref:Uncharacterized protein n=1 Tax=Synaphobranchus kaupii TaxID=118154 RepID=A0A9Q1EMI8_SYNKA|nr:hypothetical protein SKAU_G00338340 [Synaphobranchus kaupii]
MWMDTGLGLGHGKLALSTADLTGTLSLSESSGSCTSFTRRREISAPASPSGPQTYGPVSVQTPKDYTTADNGGSSQLRRMLAQQESGVRRRQKRPRWVKVVFGNYRQNRWFTEEQLINKLFSQTQPASARACLGRDPWRGDWVRAGLGKPGRGTRRDLSEAELSQSGPHGFDGSLFPSPSCGPRRTHAAQSHSECAKTRLAARVDRS